MSGAYSPSHCSDFTTNDSPFNSPFYSGRTAYGGAASGQRVRFKRPRVETSPPPAPVSSASHDHMALSHYECGIKIHM